MPLLPPQPPRRRPRTPEYSGAGDVSLTSDGRGGLVARDGRSPSEWARIASHVSANEYTAIRLDDGDTAYPDRDTLTVQCWELNGSATVKVGTKVRIEPNRSGPGYTFRAGVGGTTASGADSCAAVLLADANNCVQVSVVEAAGLCAGVDTAQVLELTWDTDKFKSGLTDWTNADATTGQVTYTPGTTPAATISGTAGVYLGCSGDGGAVFAWKADPPCDTGTATPCGDYLKVRFDCICCSIANWDGEGWYCVRTAGSSDDYVATLLNESHRCNTLIELQAGGPYATEAEAEAACPPGITTTCCPDDPVPQTLNWTITSKTGLCSCAPTSGTVTYDAINGSWGSVDFSCLLGECEENAQYYLACVSGTWRYGTSNPPTGSDLAAASVTCNPLSIAFNKTALGDTYTITFTA